MGGMARSLFLFTALLTQNIPRGLTASRFFMNNLHWDCSGPLVPVCGGETAPLSAIVFDTAKILLIFLLLAIKITKDCYILGHFLTLFPLKHTKTIRCMYIAHASSPAHVRPLRGRKLVSSLSSGSFPAVSHPRLCLLASFGDLIAAGWLSCGMSGFDALETIS